MSISEREAEQLGDDLVDIWDEYERKRRDSYHDSFLSTIRAVAFELRDRLEVAPFFISAKSVRLGEALCTYTRDVGLSIEVGKRRLDIPESALEQHGLVPAGESTAKGAREDA